MRACEFDDRRPALPCPVLAAGWPLQPGPYIHPSVLSGGFGGILHVHARTSMRVGTYAPATSYAIKRIACCVLRNGGSGSRYWLVTIVVVIMMVGGR